MPANLNVVLAVKGSDSLLKSSFADVAPWADDIRNYVNGEIHCNSL